MRERVDPYVLYLVLQVGMSVFLGIAYTTSTVYWVTQGRLNPLQLVLLGTVLEGVYFVCQLPTGVFADLVSRRWSVVAGVLVIGVGAGLQGLSAGFPVLVAGQGIFGLGAALMYGAEESWIADELGDDARMTAVYVRATQVGLIGTVAGSVLSGVIALAALNVPMLTAGSGLVVLGLVLAVIMPEHHVARRERSAVVARRMWRAVADQGRATGVAILAVPGLVLLFGMVFFTGLWSESFDRLWGAFLLRDITFPHVIPVTLWFSGIAAAVALLGLGSAEVAKRRSEGRDSVVGTLLVVTVGIGVGVVVLALAHSFAVAIVAYLVIAVLRPLYEPLLTGWMVARIEPGTRATALSAKDMFDSAGQIVGGPGIGLVGNAVSIRAALLAGAAALAPAVALLLLASRLVRRASPRVQAQRLQHE